MKILTPAIAATEQLEDFSIQNKDGFWVDEQGRFHKEDGPYYKTTTQERWAIHGISHRVDGPAITYHLDELGITLSGVDKELYWYKEGILHCEDGPSVINGYGMRWHKNGKLHREDGPAAVFPDKYGKAPEYFLNGIKMSLKDFELAQYKKAIGG